MPDVRVRGTRYVLRGAKYGVPAARVLDDEVRGPRYLQANYVVLGAKKCLTFHDSCSLGNKSATKRVLGIGQIIRPDNKTGKILGPK